MTRWGAAPLLVVEHLSMQFGGLIAIDDVSFTIGKGDITALIGPNGAGKTTVFNCVTGFYKPTRGRIALAHEGRLSEPALDALTASGARFAATHGGPPDLFLLERMPDHEITARARVARTFQNIRLFPGMTVLENLIVAQHNALMRASGYSILGLIGAPSWRAAERHAVERSQSWLDLLALTARADDPAGSLPYGDQRRLEIARAMLTDPVLLCLDEPAAGLNPRESAELTGLLRHIRDTHGVSILLIEHDMAVVMEIAEHLIVLEYGRKIADDEPETVRNDPRVVAAYLGVEDKDVETLSVGGQV